ncbi:hypothetical protein MiSe_51420 [Microseira wollei NIES-4236]|uniref:Uncharacterized protein n=1 Tax=Microseira wollei NIES-4236 TaxID=2530354 RepID=A0AAV3XFQ6_9CYAN|nr:hypothetical protein MiSe_51420 [Microseira wollei NIES-4236]
MDNWANQSHFLEQDTSFVSPLESAGNLGNYQDISGLQIISCPLASVALGLG